MIPPEAPVAGFVQIVVYILWTGVNRLSSPSLPIVKKITMSRKQDNCLTSGEMDGR